MKLKTHNLSALQKLLFVFLCCLLCVFASRCFLFGIYCNHTEGPHTLTGYLRAFNQYDSGWYAGIIDSGYADAPSGNENGDAANWAFFPAFPYFCRFFVRLFHMETGLLVPVLNSLLFTLALFFAYRYLTLTRDRKTAVLYIVLASFGMYTFYFSSMYSESLYLLLLVLFFLCMKTEHYLLMGVFGALASATRNTGIMLVFAMIPYCIERYLQDLSHKGERRSFRGFLASVFSRPTLVLGTCLVPLGLFAFMLFLYQKTGDGLAFVHIQRAWGLSDGNILYNLYMGLQDITHYNFYLALWGLLGILSIYLLFKQKRYDEAIVTLIFVLVPLSVRLYSIPRYLIGSFFPFVTLCEWLSHRTKLEIVLGIFLSLVMSHILYIGWINAAPYLI